MSTETHNTPPHLTTGLAMLGGLGMFLALTGLALGVIQGAEADGGLIGLLLVVGLMLLALAVASWMAVVRPFDHFDDINQPIYHGHHHEEHGSDESHSASTEAEGQHS